MSYFQGDSIFWVEVAKIKPNPHQPRKEFDEEKLKSLAESIRQYGVLQPLVVTRREYEKPEGGIAVEYELIAGERRLRAADIATIQQVPVIIKSGQEDALLKLELAIIENVQREDLNPIDRAVAFQRLAEEFGFKHTQIGKKIGKSREFISNTLRLLSLPQEIKDAVASFAISEGHGRTLMMLNDRPEEQMTLFKEIVYKNLTVREAETIARRIAHDKVRKKERAFDPELMELEDKLSESLGTRVQIERKDKGGKIMIDYFSNEDIKNILTALSASGGETRDRNTMLKNFIAAQEASQKNEHASETHSAVDGNSDAENEQSKTGDVPTAPSPEQETQIPPHESDRSSETDDSDASLAAPRYVSREEEAEPESHSDTTEHTSSDSASHEEGEPNVSRPADLHEEGESLEHTDNTETDAQKNKDTTREDDEDLYSVSNFTI